VIGSGLVAWLYKRGQNIGGILLLVLLILIFMFYGLRWFPGGNLNGTRPGNVVWPPIVNMCPDFMVSWTDTTTKHIYCYDKNNVYNLASGGSGQESLNIDGVSTSVYKIFNYTANPPANLAADIGGTTWPFLKKLSDGTVFTDTGKLIRWEGVYDGQNLTVNNAPLPGK